MDDNNNKNLILATVLSFLVIMVWFVLFPPPEPEPAPAPTSETATTDLLPPEAEAPANPEAAGATVVAEPEPEAPRLPIATPSLEGSVSLRGGRIDDISLRGYRETLAPNSPIVRLLAPVGTDQPFYALFGWSAGAGLEPADVPGARTEWQAESDGPIAPGQPAVLRWDNGKGLAFTRTIAVDDKFMFTVTDSVTNNGAAAVSLAPYSQIARHGQPANETSYYIVHTGVIAQVDGTREESGYGDVSGLSVIEREGNPAQLVEATHDGWIGFTDHYWMAVLVPEQGRPFTEVTKYVTRADIYQTEVREPLVTLAPGATTENRTRLFAGAKEWATIRGYENDPGLIAGLFGERADPDREPIPGFINAIDWGWFYFLTKPIFSLLHWLKGAIGNMGLAIIALTFVLKIIVLPLAYKSYVSMARMKELQPEMEALKERAGKDRQMLQKEMMKLYRDRKVNPAAGCLPVLIQVPIFFSLYKVIFVTIELRHAPFFGWLKDLSAPDPSSLFNLFGVLPWAAPPAGSLLHLVFIGVLPIVLGLTMWLQQRLNPAPTDAVQAQIFAWMPWVFMFMMSGFASGLIVYWITNNTITFVQQYLIMRSHGHKPDLFGNIRASVARRRPTAANADRPPSRRGGKSR